MHRKSARRPSQPTIKLGNLLMVGSLGAFEILSQSLMVLILVFFLLLSGDTFKHKMVRVTGPALSDKKITVHILDDINRSIQSYMFTTLVTNALLALLTWIAFRWIGLDNAGGWAMAAGNPPRHSIFGARIDRHCDRNGRLHAVRIF